MRVQGTHRHAAEIQLLQQLADAALMPVNIEFGGDAVTPVSTAPAPTPSVLRSGPLSTHAATLYLSIANRREAGEVTDASQPDTPQGHGARV